MTDSGRGSSAVCVLIVAIVTGVGLSSCGSDVSEGAPCKTNSDCRNPEICVAEIAKGCAAELTCRAAPPGAQCGGAMELCGCNGDVVVTGCGFPSGYASGRVAPSRQFPHCSVSDAGEGGPPVPSAGADASP